MNGGADETIRRVLPRGRNALDRETVGRSQRARLIEAMRELAAREGIAKVSIAKLVARAGVGKPTFYDHFESKEDCFIATLDESAAGLIGAMSAVLNPEDSLEVRIDLGIGALIEFMASEIDAARIIAIESLAAGPEVAVRHVEIHQMFADFYAAEREATRAADPSIPPLSDVRVQGIVGAIFEPISHALRVGGVDDVRAVRGELIKSVALLARGHES